MTPLKLSRVTLALAAAGMLLSMPALSQDDAAEKDDDSTEQQLEVIEVKGFSTSLIQSLNQKRFGDTVSEQISADDLGGLPDVSMADALTRLPGISAVRTGGQAAEINIRGLSGDFVFSTLNGREQVSTSGDRSIEFDQYPSELINSAAVYKSPKASLIEGGVAGTVELKTASALNNEQKHTLNMNARGMFNDRADEVPDAEEYGHRLSFSYQGKYLDDTLGVSVGYARLFQPSSSTQFIGFSYDDQVDVDGVEGDIEGPDSCPECEYVSHGFEMQHKGGEETRNGYMAALEWAPTNNFTLKADAFVSKFDSEEFARGFRVLFDAAQGSVANPIIQDNIVLGGNFVRTKDNDAHVEVVNDDNRDYDSVGSFGINANWQINDSWTASVDISHSRAESDFRNGLLWALPAVDANADIPQLDENISLSFQPNGLDLPDIGLSQTGAFTDTDRLMVSKYGIYPFENDDQLDAYRLDFEYMLPANDWVRSIEFGARHSSREYNNKRSVFEFGSGNSFRTDEPPLRLTEDMVEQVNWQGEFAYFPSYLAIDQDKALDAWFPSGRPQPVQTWGPGHSGVINGPGEGSDYSWTMFESGSVFEDVTAAYVQVNIDTYIGELPVTGNFGVRAVDTKQSSTVYQPATKEEQVFNPDIGKYGDYETVVVGDPAQGAQYITDEVGLISDHYRFTRLTDEYTDYLPSLNLNFQISDTDQIRFAAAKVMGRAPINRLFANANVRVDEVFAVQDPETGDIELSSPTAKINGSATNSPYLRPFYATQYDLSFERYFDDTEGAFVAALFYKDIESFIDTFEQSPFDFAANGFNVPTEVEAAVVDPDGEPILGDNGEPMTVTVPTENGSYTTAVNNKEGGYIRGLELAYTQIFDFLPDMWSGLGVSASYSYTESEIQKQTSLSGASVELGLPGLSENVATITAFWEYEGFETRLSTRYRDAFVSKQVAVNEQEVNFDSETVVDYQASYDVNDNLGVLFQVNNLTDEPTKSYFGQEELTGTIQYFGTQYYLGVTYQL